MSTTGFTTSSQNEGFVIKAKLRTVELLSSLKKTCKQKQLNENEETSETSKKLTACHYC